MARAAATVHAAAAGAAGAAGAAPAAAALAEPRWMEALRAEARKRFQAMAWPTTAEEEWRRTDVSRAGLDAYAPAGARAAAEAPRPWAADHGSYAGLIRFQSGACSTLGLDPALAAKGVRFLPLADALEEFETPLHSLYGQALEEADNRFLAWHYAEWSHGALLWVPAGLEIAEPFLVDFEEGGDGLMSAPHLAVFLGTGARASVIHRLGSHGAAKTGLLCNPVVDVKLGDAAGLALWEQQQLSPADIVVRHTRAAVARDASLRHFGAELGARLSKTRVDCSLDGPGAEAFLDGAYYCGKGQHMDLRTVQRHRSPKAMSRAVYKGAVGGGGRTVFQGLIEVSPGASGTDAWLTNRNLILGETARSDSIPTLKIGNNDVKCSHGSTTGKLNPEELFYLQTRGYSSADAREMLVIGYFEDLLSAAPEGFREETLSVIRSRLMAA